MTRLALVFLRRTWPLVVAIGIGIGIGIPAVAWAGPAAAAHAASMPAGSAGLCNDGTYTSVADIKHGCRGHKGLQDRYAASATRRLGQATISPATAAPPTESTAAHPPIVAGKPPA